MREQEPARDEPEVEPAPMDLTVGDAILAAAELNSGVPPQRADDHAAEATRATEAAETAQETGKEVGCHG